MRFLIPLGLCLLAACGRKPDFGVELTYRMIDPKAAVLQQALAVIQSRAKMSDLPAEARIEGSDRIIVRVLQDDLATAKQLFPQVGRLDLLAAAPLQIQERYNGDRVVAEGYRAIDNPEPRKDPGYEAWGREILVRMDPVIEGRHVVMAGVRQEMMPDGMQWVTTFELDPEGAKQFDDAAAILHNFRPEGLVAIVFDGKLRNLPAVKSPKFQGKGQITGAKNQAEARTLAVILRSGPLPAPVELESEKPFGPPEKK